MSFSSHRYRDSNLSFNQRIDVPIHRVSNNSHYKFNEQHTQNEINSKTTTVQWINDPIANQEKFRMKINVEGFNQNEVRIRVEGNKLFIYGERIENKSQGTSKKIIEQFYELPPDVDTFRPHVIFPSPVTMQVGFPSKRSFTQSSGHTSARKLNVSNGYHQNTISDSIPIHRIASNASDPSIFTARSISPVYKFPGSVNDSAIDKTRIIHKQIHRRSGSPALSDIIEEDHFPLNTHRSLTATNSSDSNTESTYFPRDFNSDVFFRSVFQPEIITNDRDQRYIEMKLNIHDYNPDEIKVSFNDNDLIVQAEHRNFYKQITLPSNTDFTSLTMHYHHDGKLYLTVKLLDEYSTFKYI